MSKQLNLICFDNPYPPNYGGVIDVFYKIKALHELGVSIDLHYFAKQQKDSEELFALCNSVTFYPKSPIISKYLFGKLPFRMQLRRSEKLLLALRQSNAPILYEGLYSAYSSLSSELASHKKFLRCHNVEADYARQLAKIEDNIFKKLLFYIEGKKNAFLERDLTIFDALFALSEDDQRQLKPANSKTIYVPVFHAHRGVDIKEGTGSYVLFHGNLTVKENLETAKWISNEIAPKAENFKFLIAGKSKHRHLSKMLSKSNVECIFNPDQKEMKELIQNAQFVLLKTSVPSGIKLKLIDSLALSRHIISDFNSVKNSGLQHLVNIANKTEDVLQILNKLQTQEITKSMKSKRQEIFDSVLNNHQNASKIIDAIF